jgi:tripartite-type tricarboxylate transporter receptor subunit TctC
MARQRRLANVTSVSPLRSGRKSGFTMRSTAASITWAAALACGLALAVTPAAAQQPFYKDKTVELIISTGAGGGLDTNARLVARHLPKHIPGHPTIVSKNMPGAGHIRAANYIANQAPKDGTTIGTLIPAFVMAQVLQRSEGIQFDAAKLQWLASTSASNSSIYVWRASGVASMEDAKTRPVLMGGTGSGSYTTLYPLVLNHVIGTKFKIITGYISTAEIRLAMERGEVEGRAGNNLNSLRQETGDWLKDNKIVLLAQVGIERDKDFPDVPLMLELAKSKDDQQVLRLFSADVVIGRPFLTGPGVPAERVAILRKAFEDLMVDPEFLKEAAASEIDISPVSGDRVQALVEDLIHTPADIVARAKLAMQSADAADAAAGGKGKKQ